MKRPTLPIAAAALALIMGLPAQTAVADSPVSYVRPLDPAHVEASIAAQATLPIFLNNAFDRTGEGIRGTSLLILLGTPPMIEEIWVSPFFRTGDQTFAGHIEGLPRRLTNLMVGRKVPFDQANILDWSIALDDGKVYGRYRDRARFAGVPANRQTVQAGRLSEKPVPKGWDQ